jgi:hypothetical protein
MFGKRGGGAKGNLVYGTNAPVAQTYDGLETGGMNPSHPLPRIVFNF